MFVAVLKNPRPPSRLQRSIPKPRQLGSQKKRSFCPDAQFIFRTFALVKAVEYCLLSLVLRDLTSSVPGSTVEAETKVEVEGW